MNHAEIKSLNLTWGKHVRKGADHTEWHAPCGCAYHSEPYPHVHPCSDAHDRSYKEKKTKQNNKLPCIAPIGSTTCGYPKDACMHKGSTLPEPPAGRHKYQQLKGLNDG